MEDIVSCFMQLKTVSGNLETGWVCSPFSLKKDSSSKLCWLSLEVPEIFQFISEVSRRQQLRKTHKNNFEFTLSTETVTLHKCRCDFAYDSDMTRGIYISFFKRQDNI